jgi:hypothetical protein
MNAYRRDESSELVPEPGFWKTLKRAPDVPFGRSRRWMSLRIAPELPTRTW